MKSRNKKILLAVFFSVIFIAIGVGAMSANEWIYKTVEFHFQGESDKGACGCGENGKQIKWSEICNDASSPNNGKMCVKCMYWDQRNLRAVCANFFRVPGYDYYSDNNYEYTNQKRGVVEKFGTGAYCPCGENKTIPSDSSPTATCNDVTSKYYGLSCYLGTYFTPPYYSVSTGSSPNTGGSVTVSPAKNGYGGYFEGTTVTVTANASGDYAFVGWSGSLSGSSNPASVVVGGDLSITANFKVVPKYKLNILISGSMWGGVDKVSGTEYAEGSQVIINAIPKDNGIVSSWGQDASGTGKSVTITMNKAKTVLVTFKEDPIVAEARKKANEELLAKLAKLRQDQLDAEKAAAARLEEQRLIQARELQMQEEARKQADALRLQQEELAAKLAVQKQAAATTKTSNAQQMTQQLTSISAPVEKKEVITILFNKFDEINQRMTDQWAISLGQLRRIVNSIVSRAEKAQLRGFDIANILSLIDKSINNIEKAQLAVEKQAGKSYQIKVTTISKLKANALATRSKLDAELQVVEALVKTSNDLVNEAFNLLKAIPNIDNLE